MATESNKWIDVIAKLIKITQEGRLRWRVATDDFSVVSRNEKEAAFITQYKENILRISRLNYKVEDPGSGPLSAFTSGASLASSVWVQRKYPYWTSSIILEFVDSKGQSLWRFPDTNALNDLYSSVQYQVAGVSEFLDDILRDG